jgi:hypothetical protein
LPAAEREALGAWLTEYDKVHDAAWAEYDKVCDAARAEYVKVCDAAWAERDKVRDAARAEYDKGENASPLAAWVIEAHFADYKDEATTVLEALRDGASWQDLQDLAEIEGWCETWNAATDAARERFDIS